MNEKEAEKLYDEILKKEIYPLLGSKTTFLNDLNRIGRKLFGVKFRGVFASDKIPKLNDLKPYCILNLDRSDQRGSHWVSFCKIINSDGINPDSIIYDSFGRSHSKIIPTLEYSGNGRILGDTDDSEQRIDQTDCGARCMAWIAFLDRYGVKSALLI